MRRALDRLRELLTNGAFRARCDVVAHVSRWLLCCSSAAAAASATAALAVGGEHPYVRCLAARPPAGHAQGRRARAAHREARAAHRRAALPGHARCVLRARRSARRRRRRSSPRARGQAGPRCCCSATSATTRPTARATLDRARLVAAADAGRRRRARHARRGSRTRSTRLPRARPSASSMLRPCARVRIGHDTLVPVAGALDGRYALSDDACGYARSRPAEARRRAGRRGRAPLAARLAGAGLGGSVRRRAHRDGLDLGQRAARRAGHAYRRQRRALRMAARAGDAAERAGGARRRRLGDASADLQLVVAAACRRRARAQRRITRRARLRAAAPGRARPPAARSTAVAREKHRNSVVE